MSHVAEAFDFRTAVEKTIAQWKKYANRKDAAGLAGLYAEDATLLPPGMPAIKGRQNIQKFFEGFFAAGASDARLWPVDVAGFGDMAFEIGAFEATLPVPQGGTARTEGKYLVVWKRRQDGTIQLLVDMFNANA